MTEWLTTFMPHVVDKWSELVKSLGDTLYMVGFSGVVSFAIGLFLGVVITVTKPRGLFAQPAVYRVLDKLIDLFRSVPFIILLTALIPLTRAIAGTAIGTKGAIVPLVFGTVPFFTRQIESALAEVDGGLIEAAQAMGLPPFKIVWRVLLRESIPGIVRGTMITFVSLVGLSAMAGAVGGGGLGDFAIRYGHQRNQTDITWVTVLILLIVVSLIQALGQWLVRKTTH